MDVLTHRTGEPVLGFAGRHDADGLAFGGFVRSAGRQPVFFVTRLLPAAPSQPFARSTTKRYWVLLSKTITSQNYLSVCCIFLYRGHEKPSPGLKCRDNLNLVVSADDCSTVQGWFGAAVLGFKLTPCRTLVPIHL